MIRFLGFLYSSWNWLYAVLPFLIVLLWYSTKKKSRFLLSFGDRRTLENYSSRKKIRVAKFILLIVFIILILVALNRPQIKGIVSHKIYRGADVVFVVDVSLSMRAEDAVPDEDISRLELIKDKLVKLSHELGDERVALVIFAGESFPWIPFLSNDKSVFRFFINRLSTDLISKKGTDIGRALLSALKIIKESRDKSAEHLIFLLTDGELQNEDAKAFTKAMMKVRSSQVKLQVMGMGSRIGALIPVVNERGETEYVKDKQGKLVRSRLQEGVLKQLAQIGKGQYKLLKDISLSSLIKSEKTLVRVAKKESWKNIYQWFLIAALLALAVWFLL